MDIHTMYVIGSLIAGLASSAAFIWGVKAMQEQEEARWKEEWREQIDSITRQIQSVSG